LRRWGSNGGNHLSLYETHRNGPANDAAGRAIQPAFGGENSAAQNRTLP
jgi:hypothetical protein